LQSLFITIATAGLIGTVAMYGVALAGTLLHYVIAARRNDIALSLKGFGGHLLPSRVLRSRWTRLDIVFYLSNKLSFALIFPSVAGMAALAALMVKRVLDHMLGFTPLLSQNTTSFLMFLAATVLLRDFMSFFVHYFQHRVPLLWEFHKVHHAPESLIPPTSHRLHPLDQIPNMVAEAIVGLMAGVYAWLVDQSINDLIGSWIGVYILVNIVTFAPLRHSHITLRLGVLERFLLSPAHHVLHHSRELQHRDRNFGAYFPIWDHLFGTLLKPPAADTYRLGLPGGESSDYLTLTACYVEPFRKIRRKFSGTGVAHMLQPSPVYPRTVTLAMEGSPD
jgi:sterol desaturase/sphingolipid hydroxylase (fatty acid hydroxylase superfamily)